MKPHSLGFAHVKFDETKSSTSKLSAARIKVFSQLPHFPFAKSSDRGFDSRLSGYYLHVLHIFKHHQDLRSVFFNETQIVFV